MYFSFVFSLKATSQCLQEQKHCPLQLRHALLGPKSKLVFFPECWMLGLWLFIPVFIHASHAYTHLAV